MVSERREGLSFSGTLSQCSVNGSCHFGGLTKFLNVYGLRLRRCGWDTVSDIRDPPELTSIADELGD